MLNSIKSVKEVGRIFCASTGVNKVMAGVIQAERGTERAGTGTHRRFSRDEAIIACFIRAFASRQVAIGELKAISENLRHRLIDPHVKRDIEVVVEDAWRWRRARPNGYEG